MNLGGTKIRGGCCAVLMGVLSLWAARDSRAQVCIGDCRGVGQVEISDLVLAVNIALGDASFEQCPALGVGPIDIATLITSVNNALCSCCVTEPPATATDSPSPTESPTPVPMVSTWHEDQLKLQSSTCPRQINDAVRNTVQGKTFDYTVRQSDQQVEIGDGFGTVVYGTIDADGNVEAHEVVQQSEGACVVTEDIMHAVNLSHSPTTSKDTDYVSTMNCPNPVTCTLVITSRWTRTSPLLVARRRPPLGLFGALARLFIP